MGRRPVTPIRFVCGCQNGHLQDIDWKWIVHNGATCQEPMWIEDVGTSAEPRDTRVRCGCGRFISLDELFIKGRLGKCMGERPWIGDREAGCTDSLRLLTRSATNTYFPQVASVISLPIAEDELTKHVSEIQHMVGGVTEASQIETLRLVPQVASTLKGYTNADVFERLRQLREAITVAAAKDPRVAEFELPASGKKVIGEPTVESRLHAETLDRDAWDPHRVIAHLPRPGVSSEGSFAACIWISPYPGAGHPVPGTRPHGDFPDSTNRTT